MLKMEDDRVILLNQQDESVDDDEDNLIDPSGMFSLTEITNKDNIKVSDAKVSHDPSEDHDTSSMTYVAAVIAALGGLLFGYDIGIISGAKTQIQYEIGLTCTQIEAIVAMLPVGAMLASLLAGKS